MQHVCGGGAPLLLLSGACGRGGPFAGVARAPPAAGGGDSGEGPAARGGLLRDVRAPLALATDGGSLPHCGVCVVTPRATYARLTTCMHRWCGPCLLLAQELDKVGDLQGLSLSVCAEPQLQLLRCVRAHLPRKRLPVVYSAPTHRWRSSWVTRSRSSRWTWTRTPCSARSSGCVVVRAADSASRGVHLRRGRAARSPGVCVAAPAATPARVRAD